MFEHWPIIFDPPPYRIVDPPTPVLVRLPDAIARSPAKLGAGVSLRIRAGGLDLDQTVPGRLLAWATVSTGEWLAYIAFRVKTGNDMGWIDITQWCPASAITPTTETNFDNPGPTPNPPS